MPTSGSSNGARSASIVVGLYTMSAPETARMASGDDVMNVLIALTLPPRWTSVTSVMRGFLRQYDSTISQVLSVHPLATTTTREMRGSAVWARMLSRSRAMVASSLWAMTPMATVDGIINESALRRPRVRTHAVSRASEKAHRDR